MLQVLFMIHGVPVCAENHGFESAGSEMVLPD